LSNSSKSKPLGEIKSGVRRQWRLTPLFISPNVITPILRFFLFIWLKNMKALKKMANNDQNAIKTKRKTWT
jgi:hypothetical protein